MKMAILILIGGLVVTICGFIVLFGSIGPESNLNVAFFGIAMVIFGPLIVIGGFVTYTFREPTLIELENIDEKNHRTWHIRPGRIVLCFLLIVIISGIINFAVNNLFEINEEALRASITGGLIVGFNFLICFHRFRHMIFYPEKKSKSDACIKKI